MPVGVKKYHTKGCDDVFVDSSQSLRYMPLLIPAFFDPFLHILTLRRAPVRCATLVLCAVLLPLLSHTRDDLQVTRGFTDEKQRRKACYLKIENMSAAITRLAYLKQHHLNLFAEQ